MKTVNWELFRWQALNAVGLWNHLKAEEAWSLALKHGHQGGTDEILAHLADIAEVFLEEV